MIIFPAIDLYGGKAVRLYKGDYAQMTVYNDHPELVACDFVKNGATHIHLVDLEGAKFGNTPNLSTIEKIVKSTNLFVEVGGGIRSLDVIETYIRIGVNRVILGTSAVTDPEFLAKAVAQYGDKIAVGVDIKDGYVAIKGWTEKSDLEAFAFCEKLEKLGVKTVICTDISKDGAMQGANHSLYEELFKKFSIDFIASGGVSSIDDVRKLAKRNMYGAIIGKAYYTGAINLKEAIEVAENAY
ncbi:MAG: 1-(5-phosphoribosyl)-5-[(5-phosphoribosylamino)methylideneamino]imidazole-4-carboxamide isomerase [Clostridiales bacterium]|nr:1-(5-phosphoribosyl)-5-[(5-phosphoribosylamino)methylideneamino]imidazole-4-carboxamide isomerase [Clostridiales bacterium]